MATSPLDARGARVLLPPNFGKAGRRGGRKHLVLAGIVLGVLGALMVF